MEIGETKMLQLLLRSTCHAPTFPKSHLIWGTKKLHREVPTNISET